MDNWEETEAEEQNGECLEEKESSSVPDDKEANQTEQQPPEKPKSSARWDQFYRKIVKPFLIYASLLFILGNCDICLRLVDNINNHLRPYTSYNFTKITSNRPQGTICVVEGNNYKSIEYATIWSGNTIYLYDSMAFTNILWQEKFPGQIESAKCQFTEKSDTIIVSGFMISVVYKADGIRKLKCFNIDLNHFKLDVFDLSKMTFSQKIVWDSRLDFKSKKPTQKKEDPPYKFINAICDIPIGDSIPIETHNGILLQTENKQEMVLLDYKGKELSRKDFGKPFIFGTYFIHYYYSDDFWVTAYDGRMYEFLNTTSNKIQIVYQVDTVEKGVLEKSIIQCENKEKTQSVYSTCFYDGTYFFKDANDMAYPDGSIFKVKLKLDVKGIINNNLIETGDGRILSIDDVYQKYYPYIFKLDPIICLNRSIVTENKYTYLDSNWAFEEWTMLCKSKIDESLYLVAYGMKNRPNMHTQIKLTGIDEPVDFLSITQKGGFIYIFLANDKSVFKFETTVDEIVKNKPKRVYMEMAEEPLININEY